MPDKTYNNPVISGFFPDPSIVRIGEDYFIVNSTFQYFPAIVISHSRDLVNWEIIGHAVTENDYLDISDLDDSLGIWAPDISYHNNTYYIFATLRLNGSNDEADCRIIRRQIIMKSDKPEGPYSKPVFIDIDGIDPSHFVDDDGTHYMVIHPGVRLVRLNNECTEALSEPVVIWEGTSARCPEGPHIFKKDNYYYILLAEGGTGYGHMISSARSKKLSGPYEPSPYNPIMTQKNTEALIQRAGHGKFVKTQNNEWWVAYLCGRKNLGNFTTLGRETALDPVQETDDGWFIINNGKGPSAVQKAPDLSEQRYTEKFFDNFDNNKLELYWQFVRNPDNSAWSLTERQGFLRLWTLDYDLDTIKAKNTLLRREKHHKYAAGLSMEFYPQKKGQQAGLVCYYGIHCYIKLFTTFDKTLKLFLLENRNDVKKIIFTASDIKQNNIFLKVEVSMQKRQFYFSYDNKNWKNAGSIEDASFLSDEGATIGKTHTGTLVGMYANNGGTGERISADFDWFNYTF